MKTAVERAQDQQKLLAQQAEDERQAVIARREASKLAFEKWKQDELPQKVADAMTIIEKGLDDVAKTNKREYVYSMNDIDERYDVIANTIAEQLRNLGYKAVVSTDSYECQMDDDGHKATIEHTYVKIHW